MNTISIHIDETLNPRDLEVLQDSLRSVPHVVNVALNSSAPHDMLVDFEEHHNIPVVILDSLHKQGLHTDIQAC